MPEQLPPSMRGIRAPSQQQPQAEPAAGEEEVANASPATPVPGLVAGIQQRQAERDRLLGLCEQLKRQHRCPGRCVLRGELGRGGLAAFDELS